MVSRAVKAATASRGVRQWDSIDRHLPPSTSYPIRGAGFVNWATISPDELKVSFVMGCWAQKLLFGFLRFRCLAMGPSILFFWASTNSVELIRGIKLFFRWFELIYQVKVFNLGVALSDYTPFLESPNILVYIYIYIYFLITRAEFCPM